MKKLLYPWLLHIALVGALLAIDVVAADTQYVVANNDQVGFSGESIGFYTIGSDASLTFKQAVTLSGPGIGGGYFGTNRLSMLNSEKQGCVYASEAGSGEIVGIVVSSLTVGGTAKGSATDAGTSNGIGLAMNAQYLYASFTDSNTIGTFAVKSDCGISFLKDAAVGGLQQGIINGMAVHGDLLIATYTDGSIESFDISGGTPVSNDDKQYSTGTLTSQGATYPNSIDITKDGHYAIFGDTSTQMVVEVSDISTGKLTKTAVYSSAASINSSNIMLSPDETVLYVVNTEGDSVSVMFFDEATGKLSGGCTSGALRGLSKDWSYLAGLALMSRAGNGGGIYVAEFGSTSGIAMVQLDVSGAKCSLHEMAASPVTDLNSPGLLSIGNFPPRPF
jgi:DNA-binding beta-propeller fold protein YncE